MQAATMSKSLGLLVAAMTVCLAPSWAQTRVVLPRNFNTVGWFGLFEHACGGNGPARVQNLFYVDPAAAGTVLQIAFRRGFNPSSSIDVPARSIELDLGMGHSLRSAAAASQRFADNRAPDFRSVVRRQVFNFPAVRAQSQAPFPFSYRIPLDMPFQVQANRWALWEMNIHPTGGTCNWTSYALETAAHDPGFPYPITQIGQKCPAPAPGNRLYVQQQLLGLRTAVVFDPPEIPFYLDNVPLLFVGTRSDSWQGLRLPLDLTPYGAPGCFVNISLDIVWPPAMTLRASGDVVTLFMFEVPNDIRLLGGDLYFQAVRLRSATNALGIVTSEGWHTRVGPPSLGEGCAIFAGMPHHWPHFHLDWGQKRWAISYVTEFTLQ